MLLRGQAQGLVARHPVPPFDSLPGVADGYSVQAFDQLWSPEHLQALLHGCRKQTSWDQSPANSQGWDAGLLD